MTATHSLYRTAQHRRIAAQSYLHSLQQVTEPPEGADAGLLAAAVADAERLCEERTKEEEAAHAAALAAARKAALRVTIDDTPLLLVPEVQTIRSDGTWLVERDGECIGWLNRWESGSWDASPRNRDGGSRWWRSSATRREALEALLRATR